MSENRDSSVLRRKARIGQEQFQARAMTAARALRMTLAKVAEDEMGLALAAIGLTETRGAAEPVLEALDDTTLMVLLDSPGRGPGAALIDSALAGAVVQQQTTGRVSELRENAPLRKPTRTDAALIAPLLDKLFERAGLLPDTTSQMQLLSGLRFGADMASTRLLRMALEASEYVHFSITVDIANGTRQGKLDLLLPLADAGKDTSPETSDDKEMPARTLEPTVMSLSAQLRVALCRIRMPLSKLADLSPGDRLPLPDGVMQNAEVLTMGGRKVAGGRLGQIDGLRAVRLDVGLSVGETSARRAADPGGDEGSQSFPEPPSAPGERELAEMGITGLPEFPEETISGLPDLPSLPGDDEPFDPGAMPDLPDLPELPDFPGSSASDMPDFPDLPDLPELPEMPMAKQG